MIDIARRMRWDPDQLTDADVIRASAQPRRPDHRIPATTKPDPSDGGDRAPTPHAQPMPLPGRTALSAGCPVAS